MDREELDIYAAYDGTVLYSLDNISPYGYRIYITHPEAKGILMYAHLSELLVKSGDKVKAGQKIGVMGCTGYSLGDEDRTDLDDEDKGPHLHISYFVDGTPQLVAREAADPTFIIQTAPAYPCNTKCSNPYGSKYFNPAGEYLVAHEGIDFSGKHMVPGWENGPIDPLFQDYLIREKHPEYFA